MLIFFDNFLNIRGKKEMLRINMQDYLENYLKAKLENEHLTPEVLENYRRAYFEETVENQKKKVEQKAAEKRRKLAIREETAAVQEKIIEEILKEYLA